MNAVQSVCSGCRHINWFADFTNNAEDAYENGERVFSSYRFQFLVTTVSISLSATIYLFFYWKANTKKAQYFYLTMP